MKSLFEILVLPAESTNNGKRLHKSLYQITWELESKKYYYEKKIMKQQPLLRLNYVNLKPYRIGICRKSDQRVGKNKSKLCQTKITNS